MVDLLPGADVGAALEYLDAAANSARNVLGRTQTGLDALNEYRSWAIYNARALRAMMSSTELSKVILTPGYDRLLGLDPRAYGNGLTSLVELELMDAVAALESAREDLEQRRDAWSDQRFPSGRRGLHAVVLDTNVLLRHSRRLPAIDWQAALEIFPEQAIVLAMPLVVVEELDNLKTATNRMTVDDQEIPVKQLARAALAQLDGWFAHNHTQFRLHQRTQNDPMKSDLAVQLLLDDLDHTRLPNNDAEIIDRALSLSPFASRTMLATHDRAMRFRARHAGLDVFTPPDHISGE